METLTVAGVVPLDGAAESQLLPLGPTATLNGMELPSLALTLMGCCAGSVPVFIMLKVSELDDTFSVGKAFRVNVTPTWMGPPPAGLMVIVPLYLPAIRPPVFTEIMGAVPFVVKAPTGAISQPAGVEDAVTV